MALVALLSSPNSTGNRALLPRIRSFCAQHPEVFHYEVEDAGQIGDALASIARVSPKVLILNGGDGTVQAALTELHHGGHFKGGLPPLAVLPNGKTNLIALDLGADSDPVQMLAQIVEIARDDLDRHVGCAVAALPDGPAALCWRAHQPVSTQALPWCLWGGGACAVLQHCGAGHHANRSGHLHLVFGDQWAGIYGWLRPEQLRPGDSGGARCDRQHNQ